MTKNKDKSGRHQPIDSLEQGIKYIDDGRFGNAIKLIDRLTGSGKHVEALQVAKYLMDKRGNATDIGVLVKTCRRSSHEVRVQEYPQVLQTVETWLESKDYIYRVQTVHSILTLLRLIDDRKKFWEIYNYWVEDSDKRENEFILAEYAQMLRQDNKDRYIAEWIPCYEGLPERLKQNNLLQKLYVQALIDEGTKPLEDIEAILQNSTDEQFKFELMDRIEELKKLRGYSPAIEPKDTEVGEQAKRAKIFISYSRVDEKLAQELSSMLDELRVDFFLDQKDIDWGSSVTTEIHKGLKECSAVVVIISPASLKSQWVPYEIGRAVGEGKRILPLLTHPSLDIPGYISDLNFKTDLQDAKSYFVQLAQQYAEEQEETNQTMPLSETAIKLLLEASQDSTGRMLKLRSSGGLVVQTHGKNLVDSQDPRTQARWENAVQQLWDYGLIQDLGHEGEVFTLTESGYELADNMREQQDNA